ncbi:hypothetical protein niasHT_032644 [Heterodera trifolii]|uniref:Uncharacterized protein n=1 Tax=Heterodera trifolii TaxID=157864 RepID=A0ABD2IUX7_9BILA
MLSFPPSPALFTVILHLSFCSPSSTLTSAYILLISSLQINQFIWLLSRTQQFTGAVSSAKQSDEAQSEFKKTRKVKRSTSDFIKNANITTKFVNIQRMAEPKAKAGKGPGPYTAEMAWKIWEERFEFFIKLRAVTDAETKKLLFFTEIGPIYEELRQMALPDDVRDMPLDEIKALMRDQYGETKTVAAKRHELFAAKQTAGQPSATMRLNCAL